MRKCKTQLIFIAIAVLFLMTACVPAGNPDTPDGMRQPIPSISTTDSESLWGEASPVPPEDDPPTEQTPEQPPELPEDSHFEVHYIDVEQGDAALILCDGYAMLIDGGESDQSNKIYAYLKEHDIEHLEYIVASHAHSDHVAGLAGALNYASVDTALCPVQEYDSDAFRDFVRYLQKQGVGITAPALDESFTLGSAVVTVLGPRQSYDEPNDTSLILKVVYGQTSFLFTGDAERTSEADLLDANCDLASTVLKVGHHGSDTSTSYPFLREVMPEYAVISVGADNSYGHPTEEVMSRLRDADVQVYRTDLQGTVICSSDGEQVSFSVERNSSIQTNPTVITPESQDPETAYIGNKNSKKYHLPTCGTLPAEHNRIYFNSLEEVLAAGFDACGNCLR